MSVASGDEGVASFGMDNLGTCIIWINTYMYHHSGTGSTQERRA